MGTLGGVGVNSVIVVFKETVSDVVDLLVVLVLAGVGRVLLPVADSKGDPGAPNPYLFPTDTEHQMLFF